MLCLCSLSFGKSAARGSLVLMGFQVLSVKLGTPSCLPLVDGSFCLLLRWGCVVTPQMCSPVSITLCPRHFPCFYLFYTRRAGILLGGFCMLSYAYRSAGFEDTSSVPTEIQAWTRSCPIDVTLDWELLPGLCSWVLEPGNSRDEDSSR